MKIAREIALPTHTVAEWGGLQEYAVGAAKTLVDAGHSVTVIGSGELFKARASDVGASFLEIDWNDLESAANIVRESSSPDLVYSHSPLGRTLGLELSRMFQIEHAVGIHGAYHDFMPSWGTKVDALLAVSPSLVHFVQRFGRAEPWKAALVPNGVPDAEFDAEGRSFAEKVENGTATIVTASRLAKDKISQLTVLGEMLPILRSMYPSLKWKVEVLGDGDLRDQYESKLVDVCYDNPGTTYEMMGWVEPDEVSRRMRNAVLAIAAGRSAVRAMATGTACVAVGARGSVGLQTGGNLRAGLWSNFGDHGFFGFEPRALDDDLREFFTEDTYEESVFTIKKIVGERHRQSHVDRKLLAELHS